MAALSKHQVLRQGMVEVGTCGRWTIYRRPEREGEGVRKWVDYYVRDWSARKKRGLKRAYRLSHNGGCFTDTGDAKTLATREPEAFAVLDEIIGEETFSYIMATFRKF